MGTPIGSAVVLQVEPRHYFREEECSATGQPCLSSIGHSEPIVSSVGCPLCALYGTSPVDDRYIPVVQVARFAPNEVACRWKTRSHHRCSTFDTLVLTAIIVAAIDVLGPPHFFSLFRSSAMESSMEENQRPWIRWKYNYFHGRDGSIFTSMEEDGSSHGSRCR